MIIVSGCARSGTSLTMELMRMTLGDARIRGTKFPQEARKVSKFAVETDEMFGYRKYLDVLRNPETEEHLKKAKDMNPNGFWESPFAMRGAAYNPRHEALLREVELETVPSICKIVAQGLAKTDPRYVTKVVYLLRDPASVAKSQERLKREFNYRTKDGKKYNFYAGMQIVSPQIFIEVTLAAAQWFKAHPDIPMHFLKYEDLMSKPVETLASLQEFLGEGDFKEAASVIDTNLNRSSGAKVEHLLMPEAETVYAMMVKKDWDGLSGYSQDKTRAFSRMNKQWFCARNEMVTQEAHCKNCHAKQSFRDQLKQVAVVNKIDWENRPCAFECAQDATRETYLTIEESIENNHWKV